MKQHSRIQELIVMAILAYFLYAMIGIADAGQSERDQEAWVVACTYSGYDCTSLTRPETKRSIGPLLGAYTFGGPAVVKINRSIRSGSNHYRTVLAHEYTHYLQDMAGVFDTLTICELESEAWDVANAYARLLSSPRLVDTKWYELYDDCNE